MSNNKVECVIAVIESNCVHNFTPEELKRYAGETASELGRGATGESFLEFVKGSRLTSKSWTLSLQSVKVDRKQMTLRGAIFHAALSNATLNSLLKPWGTDLAIVDLTGACNRLRETWKAKDESAKESVVEDLKEKLATVPAQE